jgi:AcrR family transcriptional regulator
VTVRVVSDWSGEEGRGSRASAARAAEATRRRLTPKQAAVVDRIVDAAAEEARHGGYDATTVRGAARRAGVAPATAYTYFASKDHLLAEVLWRRMAALPEVVHVPGNRARDRVAAELKALSLFVSDDSHLAAACTSALLGSGPEVRSLRVRFGAEVHRRLERALGDECDAAVLGALDLAYSGAMLWAGLGHISFADVPAALSDAARVLLPDDA